MLFLVVKWFLSFTGCLLQFFFSSYYVQANDFNLTNRFHVSVNLYNNISQMMSKCDKKKEGTCKV